MAWQKLKRQASEGDELWSFRSPRNLWKGRRRYAGFALVRDGKVLESEVVLEE